MGLFSSSNDQPPPPLQRPSQSLIGINPTYANHDQQIVLKLQERKLSFTGDDFHIKDAAGRDFLICKAKVLSLHARKEFYDVNGTMLFVIKKKIFSIHTTFEGYTPDEQTLLFTVKSSFSIGSAKLNTTFRDVDGKERQLVLRGDFFDRKASINLDTPDGPPVGHISRSFFNGREILFDQQSYCLTVAPGVDASLLAAICVCLDEKENENK
ncbi:hypothetical protein E1B28_010214 [Marasmius oreades]|uniref:Uncharacterized protein n=1 Tax=Marasmius oreades TaxID=181124 RepID=A0A9P7RXV2_9AGAR|nr:uncharacterized protein E1B28_010214 [Marasmius oreades]KAG7091161.1 hypothetical protein E1B28_010214 [Marasmius oreades]